MKRRTGSVSLPILELDLEPVPGPSLVTLLVNVLLLFGALFKVSELGAPGSGEMLEGLFLRLGFTGWGIDVGDSLSSGPLKSKLPAKTSWGRLFL